MSAARQVIADQLNGTFDDRSYCELRAQGILDALDDAHFIVRYVPPPKPVFHVAGHYTPTADILERIPELADENPLPVDFSTYDHKILWRSDHWQGAHLPRSEWEERGWTFTEVAS